MKQKLTYLFSLMLLCILGTSRTLADKVTYDAYGVHSSTIDANSETSDQLEGIKVTYGSAEWGASNSGLACGDVTYTGSLSAKSNSTVSGKTQTVGCIYLEPTVDGTVVFAATVNSDKAFYIFDETDATQITDFNPLCYYSSCLTDNEPKALYFNTSDNKLYEESTFTTKHKMYGTVTFNVTAGHKYSVGVAGSKIGFHGFTFTPVATYTTVYNLATAIAATGNIEGTTGSLAPTTAEEEANAPDLQVDATNGKVGANGDWAQINENTVLTLPGVPEGATLTFDLYNTTALTIGGTAYTNGQT